MTEVTIQDKVYYLASSLEYIEFLINDGKKTEDILEDLADCSVNNYVIVDNILYLEKSYVESRGLNNRYTEECDDHCACMDCRRNRYEAEQEAINEREEFNSRGFDPDY